MPFASTSPPWIQPTAMRMVVETLAVPGKDGDRHKPPKEVSLTDPQATWVARRARAWTRSLPMMQTI